MPLHPPTNRSTSSLSSFLPALQGLTSPVLDLASTLTLEAADDVDAENIAFLRATFEPTDNMSAEALTQELGTERRRREAQQRARSVSEEARERQIHDSRVGQLRQRHDSPEAWSDRTINRMRPPYGDGMPNHQSLFDWAPAREEEEEEAALEEILTELRRQQPNTHPEILRVLARASVDAEREARQRTSSSRTQAATPGSQSHEPSSLRSAAILQSFRRNHRILTRSREFMQRMSGSERERPTSSEHTTTTNDRWSSVYPPSAGSTTNSGRYELNRLAWQASQHPSSETRAAAHRENLDTLRRRYLENPSNKMSEFERIIKLLHVQRSPDHEPSRLVEEPESLATAGKRHSWENAARHKSHAACPPHYTSWLAPGTIFNGTQQAHPVVRPNASVSSSATLQRLVNHQNHQSMGPPWNPPEMPRNTTFDASRPWLSHTMSSAPLTFSASPPSSTPSSLPTHDRWTVKVEIHKVDYATMTLQGTMEAYNVPSLTHPATTTTTPPPPHSDLRKTTFSTYLEGELIDFTHHTLLTEPAAFGVKTTPDIDAAYWRRLEPFASLSDDEIARALLDRHWLEESLMGRYVLMRWKERCFVKPTTGSSASFPGRNAMSGGGGGDAHAPLPRPGDASTSFLSSNAGGGGGAGGGVGGSGAGDGAGYGLSISGFYYVSLRRGDGRLEGLYFDPQSSPYQHLEMRPSGGMRCGRGSWEFR